ncbi:LuxR C-terminal-related transcriptional regulator [uncultured Bacteroides sp.]|uniref:response regulator transcription factor n=1 Tax=uncultured Bacteroides sp. TaxID=162156 RepID=UPI00338FDC1B
MPDNQFCHGQMTEIGKQDSTRILSVREKQVLSLIDKGLTSKKIAETLSISINTVSRHRQEILGKLQVKNSIEACRVAKDLKLI